MKKPFLALLLLGAILFLAFFTMPRLKNPVFMMGKGAPKEPPTQTSKAVARPADPFTSPLIQSKAQIKPLSARIWNDAMASDVPREIGEYASHSMPNDSGAHSWIFLGEGKSQKKKSRETPLSEYSPYFAKNSKTHGSNKFDFPNAAATPAPPTQGRQRPNHEIEAEKRLLKEWVKTGKVSGKAVLHKNEKVKVARQRPPRKHSRPPRNPLLRAYHLARINIRHTSKKIRDSKKRRAHARNHKKNSKRKISIEKWIGKKALTSPRVGKFPPNPWNQGNLPTPPAGQYLSGRSLGPDEAAQLPWPPPKDLSNKEGWISNGANYYYHRGSKWGILSNGGWAYVVKRGKESFLYSAPNAKPMALSQNHLWAESQGQFFIEQNGKILGKSEFLLWKEKHPEAPRPIIRYSVDLTEMAITSQKKTTVYHLTVP